MSKPRPHRDLARVVLLRFLACLNPKPNPRTFPRTLNPRPRKNSTSGVFFKGFALAALGRRLQADGAEGLGFRVADEDFPVWEFADLKFLEG